MTGTAGSVRRQGGAAGARRLAGAATLAVLASSAIVAAATSAGAATDTTPPTAPTLLHVLGVSSTTVRLGWTAATDNVGVVGYDVAKWSTRIDGTKGATTITLTGLDPNRAYTFNVTARDAAGNRSSAASITVTTSPASGGDTTPPAAPTGLTVLSSTATSVRFGWTAATDNVGVTGYDLYRGTTRVTGTASSTTVTVTFATAPATASWTVRAHDWAGNISPASSAVLWPASDPGSTVTLTNRTQFPDTTGKPVEAHGGGVIKVGDYYYWFGESRNSDYSFKAVTVYRSKDLQSWEFRGSALSQSSSSELASANIERPKVIYNRSTGQYVMWMHKETASDYAQARAAVATSPTIEGPYTWRGSFRPLGTYMSRDINVFVDDDGTGYMVSAANENYDLNVYKLTSDYTNVSALVRSWPGDHREAPALFKRNGVYFMLTSAATGWSPNQQKYSTATSITGTWSAWTNVGDSTAFGSQTTYVLPIQGSQTTTYLYLGDRWGPGFGGAYADSQYVWLPIAFPSSATMSLTWYPQITVNTGTGVVTGVGPKYASFVARVSGKCMDVVNADTADKAEIIQYTCGDGTNQQFEVSDTTGFNPLIARHSGKCLDVTSGDTADGTALIQYTCTGGTNEQFQLQDAGNGYVRIVARHSGKCVDVKDASTANGARLVQNTCTSATSQQWQRQNR